MAEYAIEMMHITKVFPGIIANDDIVLQVKYGEIHALLGENGAGKSTLMSVLFGLYQPEQGEILIDGKKADISNPRVANDLGIGMVHQHFMLIKNFTVLENIILGVETVKNGTLQIEEARKKVEEISEKYKLKVDLDAKVSDISVGMQQRVEILKMLYKDNKILIFDEPTAVLTPQEIEELIVIMGNLRAEGKAIIFITHKLNEIKAIADNCTILRRGKYIGTVKVADVSFEQMSEMMVGRKVELHVKKSEYKPGETVMSLKHLTLHSKANKEKKLLNDITFDLHKNEILCIAGIEGNGQSELAQVISGLMSVDSGEISIGDEVITKKSIRYRNTHGLSFVPEDRHKHGLVLDNTLEENLSFKKYFTKEFQNKSFIKFAKRKAFAEKLIEEYDIRSGEGTKTIVRSMSGGNQQKAIVAREIDLDQVVLLAVQPTRGLDVGAIEYIHRRIVEQRELGKAVLLISFELEEVMNLSDRILVIYEGEIVGDLIPAQTTVNEIGLYMAGTKKDKVMINE